MGSRMLMTLLATGAALAASPGLAAPRAGEQSPPREGVCLYKDANYRGQYFCVSAGEDLSSIPDGLNDRISSIRVYGRAEVIVFRDGRFKGRSARFDSSVRDLDDEGWNDTISSLQVEYRGQSGGHQSYGSRQDPDRIVRRAYQDILDRDPDQAGLRLYRSRIIDDGWTEAQVRDALRNSPEYQQKHASGSRRYGSGQDPDQIVRRAYQDILERDPDPAGLRLYRSRIIDDGWTEARVRETLRNSPEYRDKHTMTRQKAQEIVRQAYLAVLKREPDPGSKGYVDKVFKDKWTQQDVERELKKSAEYRNKIR